VKHDTSITAADPAPGLALLGAAASAELAALLPPAQAQGFFRAVGRRMASGETLEAVGDMQELSARLGRFWQGLGWGMTEVTAGSDALLIRHYGAPACPAALSESAWRDVLRSVFEGAYDAWLRMLGSADTLETRGEWKGDMLELRHGR
jgi:hypothetical protein